MTPSTRASDTSVSSSQFAFGQSQPHATARQATDVPLPDKWRQYYSTRNSFHAPTPTFPTLKPTCITPSDSIEVELASGVPVPAALIPLGKESISPIVAAAQQHIANSFVQDLENILTDPLSAPSDAQVNDTYFNSLNNANEQYRALYGDSAFNQKTMQATMEAIKSR